MIPNLMFFPSAYSGLTCSPRNWTWKGQASFPPVSHHFLLRVSLLPPWSWDEGWRIGGNILYLTSAATVLSLSTGRGSPEAWHVTFTVHFSGARYGTGETTFNSPQHPPTASSQTGQWPAFTSSCCDDYLTFEKITHSHHAKRQVCRMPPLFALPSLSNSFPAPQNSQSADQQVHLPSRYPTEDKKARLAFCTKQMSYDLDISV